MIAPRPSNTSRAYWELKAEQVMDRVFDNVGRSAPPAAPLHPVAPHPQPTKPQEPIEVEVREPHRIWQRPWQIGGLEFPPRISLAIAASLGCLTLIGGMGLWQGWSEARNDLRQERNLRLLEGIRSLGTTPEATSSSGTPATPAGEALPPPPPSEPWIEELGQLEAHSAPSGAIAPLQVPLNGTLQAPAPPATATAPIASAAGATPELLGVVQIPGKPGSAIFQVGSSSTNALVGETIGSSDWKLVSTSGDSAVIQRGGVSRRVSISSGF